MINFALLNFLNLIDVQPQGIVLEEQVHTPEVDAFTQLLSEVNAADTPNIAQSIEQNIEPNLQPIDHQNIAPNIYYSLISLNESHGEIEDNASHIHNPLLSLNKIPNPLEDIIPSNQDQPQAVIEIMAHDSVDHILNRQYNLSPQSKKDEQNPQEEHTPPSVALSNVQLPDRKQVEAIQKLQPVVIDEDVENGIATQTVTPYPIESKVQEKNKNIRQQYIIDEDIKIPHPSDLKIAIDVPTTPVLQKEILSQPYKQQNENELTLPQQTIDRDIQHATIQQKTIQFQFSEDEHIDPLSSLLSNNELEVAPDKGEGQNVFLDVLTNKVFKPHQDLAINTKHQVHQFNSIEVLDQVTMRVASAIKEGDTRIQVDLYPQELGKVEISLEVDNVGHQKIQILCEKFTTFDILQTASKELEHSLSSVTPSGNSTSLNFGLKNQQGENYHSEQHNQRNEYHKTQAQSHEEEQTNHLYVVSPLALTTTIDISV